MRELAASNHMSRDGGSSGSRPGLGGNLQHMNRILGRGKGDEGAKRGRTEKQVSSLSSANADVTYCGQAIRRKHTGLEDMFLYPETTYDHKILDLWRNVPMFTDSFIRKLHLGYRLTALERIYIFHTAMILMKIAHLNNDQPLSQHII